MTLGIKHETQGSKLIIICYIQILCVFQDIFKLLIVFQGFVLENAIAVCTYKKVFIPCPRSL